MKKTQTSFDFSVALDGALPRTWAECSLAAVSLLVTDGDHNPPKRVSAGVPHLTAKNIKNGAIVYEGCSFVTEEGFQKTCKRYTPVAGDILMTCVGTLGETAIIPANAKFSADRNLAAIRPNLGLTTGRFLEFALHAPACRRIVRKGSGSTAQPHLYLRTIRNLPLRIAPLPEQRRIVAELEKQFSRLDAAVATLKRVQANLARARASVLKAAVEGRLVPTEAELSRAEGRSYEPASVLLERILEERERKHDEVQVGAKRKKKYKPPVEPEVEGLPELPEGWVWASVDRLAAAEARSITDGPFGSNLKSSHYVDKGPRVMRLQNVGDGIFRDEYAHITDEHYRTLEKHKVEPGDLLVASLGTALPKACRVPECVGPSIVKADVIRFKVHEEIDAKFVCFSLNSPPVRKRTADLVHGVGRPRLGLGTIRSIAIALPPRDEQIRIVQEVERRVSIYETANMTVERNLLRCERLRQSILKRAFEGKLVPQDPTDEPASELLARIQAQTA